MSRFAAAALILASAVSACGGSMGALPDGRTTGSIVGGSPERFARTLEGFRGKPVVVNFWATWCDPCKDEMPRFVAAAARYEGRVRFLGVDVQDDPAVAERFVRRFRVPFRSLTDPKRDIVRDQKILGLPVTQFYSSDAELTFVHTGEISRDELEEKISELLRLESSAKP